MREGVSDGSDTFKLVEREKSDRCSEGERTRVIRRDMCGGAKLL